MAEITTSLSSVMEKDGLFADFDDEQTYAASQSQALVASTRNFVVEFGKDNAQIAFNLEPEDVESLLKTDRPSERPVRWINIWAPHKQTGVVEVLGHHFKFSPRLLAIVRSKPPESDRSKQKHAGKLKTKLYQRDDLEGATSPSLDTHKHTLASLNSFRDAGHYQIARQMVSYQSVDGGPHFFCVGANWMHELSTITNDDDIISEGKQLPLWSWLVLCDDHTVLSIHEDPGITEHVEDLKSIRANTLSVLSQLSKHGRASADPISLQTVRQALESDVSREHPGIEGASNLFYYLFDDWRGVYSTVASYHQRLDNLQKAIIGGIGRKSTTTANVEVIPRLHVLGRQIRQMKHLYEGYKNLIQRVLDQKTLSGNGTSMPRSFSGLTTSTSQNSGGVVVAQSAVQRFERLGDRLQLLILSEMAEFLAEKEALISTYFNINAQKDSEATARLTRAATLLAKLSVLFLPVSLMTAYFSVQIQDLQGVYTTEDYWYSFAVVMGISFLALFFFSKMLMWITETLDGWVKKAIKAFTRAITRKLKARDAARNEDDEDG